MISSTGITVHVLALCTPGSRQGEIMGLSALARLVDQSSGPSGRAHTDGGLNDLRTTCKCCAHGRDTARKSPRCCALPNPRCCYAVGSTSSIRHILRALQDVVDEEMLSRNVARLVQLQVTDERRVRTFTRDEALYFLQAAEQHRLHALCRWRWPWDCDAAKRSGWHGEAPPGRWTSR
jgi:hypothetical protein